MARSGRFNISGRSALLDGSSALVLALLANVVLGAPAVAQDADGGQPDEIVITGSLGALPIKNVGSIFGFDKTLVDTPRAASTDGQAET